MKQDDYEEYYTIIQNKIIIYNNHSSHNTDLRCHLKKKIGKKIEMVSSILFGYELFHKELHCHENYYFL